MNSSTSEYSSSFDLTGAYSFDEAAIVDLWNVGFAFTGEEGKTKIAIELEQDHKIESSNPTEILQDPYVKHRRIIRVNIDCTNYRADPSKRVSIELQVAPAPTAPISVRISGKRDASTAVRTEIENIIRGRRLWYSTHVFPNSFAAAVAGFVLMALLCFMIVIGLLFAGFNPLLSVQEQWRQLVLQAELVLGMGVSYSVAKKAVS